MTDLVAFLRARLDEDEAAAKAAREEWTAEWVGHEWNDLPDEVYAHARVHDPARGLREVEADRLILAAHAAAHAAYREAQGLDPDDPRRLSAACQLLVWERVLKIRVSVFADHPDYDEAWKP